MEVTQDLINELINNSRKAQQELFDLFFQEMLKLSRAYTLDEVEAKSVVLEAFLDVYLNIKEFNVEKTSFKIWFNAILVKRALNNYKKNKRIREREHGMDQMILNEKFDAEDESMDYYKRFSGEDLFKLVRTLSDNERMVFTLYAKDDYSHKEIALEMGFNETTSRSHYSHAKKKLQEKLKLLDITSTNHANA